MLALALIGAVIAFAVTAKPKGKPKGRRSPFTDDSCEDLISEADLARWSQTRLRREWEDMLDEGYDPFPDEDTDFNLLVAADDLLRRTVPAGCYDADTDAYADLFRMTWCAIQMHLAQEGVLDVDEAQLIAECADDEFDPREGWVDVDTDEGEDEYEEVEYDPGGVPPPEEEGDIGEAWSIEEGNPFVVGTDPPCTELAPPAILGAWAQEDLHPGYEQALVDLGWMGHPPQMEFEDTLEIVDRSLDLALPAQCVNAPTQAYAELYRWVWCAIAIQLAADGYLDEEPEEIAAACADMPPEWDPRTDGPPAQREGELTAVPTRGNPRGPRTGQPGKLVLGNPGGMIYPTVSVSDVLLTGQMMDSHCPGSRTHPCIVDDRVVQPRQNPGCRPCG